MRRDSTVFWGRAWTRLGGDMGSIQKMQPWERSRNQQARFLRADWPQRQGWSFTAWTGFAPIIPMGIVAYATKDLGVLVTVASAIGGYLIGLLALWVGSWVVFAVRSPAKALVVARSQIEELDGQISHLTTERDQATQERDALKKHPQLEIEELIDSTIDPSELHGLNVKIARATNCDFTTEPPQPGVDESSSSSS